MLLDRLTQPAHRCVSNGPLEEWAGGGPQDSTDSDDDDGSYYPPKPVWRTANWGWKCRNHFATYTMIGTSAEFREELEKVVKARLVRGQDVRNPPAFPPTDFAQICAAGGICEG